MMPTVVERCVEGDQRFAPNVGEDAAEVRANRMTAVGAEKGVGRKCCSDPLFCAFAEALALRRARTQASYLNDSDTRVR